MKPFVTVCVGMLCAFGGCESVDVGGTRQRYQPELHGENNEHHPNVLGREWRFADGRVYKDRNGDGRVDWQNLDGLYREDNDFNGIYEIGYEEDSLTPGRSFHKRIEKPIPKIHEMYSPTFVRVR